MDDGERMALQAEDVFYLGPGHDGWVEGVEEAEVIYAFARTDPAVGEPSLERRGGLLSVGDVRSLAGSSAACVSLVYGCPGP